MKRNDFIRISLLGGLELTGSHTMNRILSLWNEWPDLGFEMPVMFVGHGAPNVAVEENEYTISWLKMAEGLPKPKAILCISAHWLTRGETRISSSENPTTLYDFGGMDERLYSMKYPAPGMPELANYLQKDLETTSLTLDNHWGFDHGAWCVLYHMFPKADVPVLQMSIDYAKGESFHYSFGKELSKLRKKGILVLAFGNIVHNLSKAIFDEKVNYGSVSMRSMVYGKL